MLKTKTLQEQLLTTALNATSVVTENKKRKRRKNKKQKENINENVPEKTPQQLQAETEELFIKLMAR